MRPVGCNSTILGHQLLHRSSSIAGGCGIKSSNCSLLISLFSEGVCKEFLFGGCGGNENIFLSEVECRKTCRSYVPRRRNFQRSSFTSESDQGNNSFLTGRNQTSVKIFFKSTIRQKNIKKLTKAKLAKQHNRCLLTFENMIITQGLFWSFWCVRGNVWLKENQYATTRTPQWRSN